MAFLSVVSCLKHVKYARKVNRKDKNGEKKSPIELFPRELLFNWRLIHSWTGSFHDVYI